VTGVQSRRGCGRGEPSPGADVGRGELLCVSLMWECVMHVPSAQRSHVVMLLPLDA
jgi:hypothetical protein